MISIIGDDRSVREAVKSLIRSLGYDAVTFASAEDLFSQYWLPATSQARLNSCRRRRLLPVEHLSVALATTFLRNERAYDARVTPAYASGVSGDCHTGLTARRRLTGDSLPRGSHRIPRPPR